VSTADTPRRPPLTRERIERTALAMIDEGGLDRLTMRRLGARLGVEAMSLYKHVAGKEAILDGVRERLLADFAEALPDDPPAGWRDDLARFARAYRALGRAHPEAFVLLARAPERAYLAGGDIAEPGLRRLIDAGLERHTAILAQRTVVRFVLGTSLLERAAEDPGPPAAPDEADALAAARPLLGELMRSLGAGSDDDLFEFGLAALLRGIGLVVDDAAGDGGS
jgi:TetR/AcrR family transcriptional regulator, tetracycline repressor protein